MPRPGPYHFTAAMLQASAAELRETRVEKLVGDTFYAVAALDVAGELRTVDARPSDALNLALLQDAPIRVNQGVLDVIGDRKEQKDPAIQIQHVNVDDCPVSASDIVEEVRETWKRP